MTISKSRIFINGCLASTAVLAGVCSSSALAQSGAAAPAAEESAGVQDIIVTATRREERNQDVPVAITAFSAERLQQQNVTRAQDLQSSVPSLVVSSNGQPSRDVQSPTLRGQGATFQASPGVVLYLNEVPLPAPISLSQQGGPGNFVDLENVQVLAGPQGTLFGRNTTGGAVLLVPHKPENNFSGYVQARLGSYNNREFEGVLNVPVIDDKLMVRAVASYQDRDGYTHDVVWNKDRDNIHQYTGRLGILFRPTERIENYLMAYGAYSNNNGTGLIHRGFNLPLLAARRQCSDLACTTYANATAIANSLGPRQTAFDLDVGQKTETWGIMNTTRFELSDNLALRNIAAYQRFKSTYLVDRDATILQAAEDIGNYPDQPVTLTDGVHTIGPFTYTNDGPAFAKDHIQTITEELQLQGTALDRKLTFTAGGFYYEQKPAGLQNSNAMNNCPSASTGKCSSARPDGGYGTSNESKALYAQATLDFGAVAPALDGLKLTGGYRYTWDHITGFSRSGTFGTGANAGKIICSSTGAAVTDIQQCTFTGDLHSSAPTWTVGLDYKAGPALLFAKISRGYKSGGFLAQSVRPSTRTFTPEYVTTYEAGFKSDFRLGTVPFRLNASYYYSDYANIQRATGDTNLDTGRSGAAIRPASARIQGIEAQAAFQPFPGLEIGGNFSYTDAKYKKYQYVVIGPTVGCDGVTKNAGETVDVTCIPFANVAPYIFSFHVAAKHQLANDMGELSFFANYAHSSSIHTEGSILPQFQPGELLEAHGLLNMSLDWNNVARSGFDVGVYVTNATNKTYRISNSNIWTVNGLWSTLYGEPRMIGARLRFRFGGDR